MDGQCLKDAGRKSDVDTKNVTDVLKKEAGAVRQDAQDIAEHIGSIVKEIESMSHRIKAAAEESVKAADDSYYMVKKAHHMLKSRLDALDDLPDVTVPYGVERLFEVAKVCEAISDTSWKRLRELAVALKTDRDREIEESKKREKEGR